MTDDAQIPPPGAADDEGQRLKDLLRVASPEPRSDPFSAIYAVRRRLARGRAYRAAGLSVLVVAGLVAGLVVSASGASDHRLPTQVAARGTSGTPRLTGILTSFNGCDAYLGYVKSQALAEVGPYGLGSEPTGPIGAGGMVSQGAIGFGAAVPDLMQSAAAAAASGSTSGYSQTDDQVAGVDEPDTVKTNGQIVVTLDGSTLRVLDQQAHVLGSTQIAGDTSGGFLLSGPPLRPPRPPRRRWPSSTSPTRAIHGCSARSCSTARSPRPGWSTVRSGWCWKVTGPDSTS